MAVCVAVAKVTSKLLRLGIYFFAAMEWLCSVGYSCFPWVTGENASHPQNMMHLAVTVLVIVFSIVSLILIAIGQKSIDEILIYISTCMPGYDADWSDWHIIITEECIWYL